MTEPSDDELDRLLARGRMGGPARDRVLGRVLEAAEPQRSRGSLWAGLMALCSAGAVAAALVLVHRGPEEGFTSKGGAAAPAPRVEAECLEGGARCPRGATLVFRVEGAGEGGLLAAYAEREGGGDRVWYFPSKNDPSLVTVPPSVGLEVLPRGARLGPEHTPGRYVVTTILVKHDMPVDALLSPNAPDVLGRFTTPIEVTP